MTTKCDTELLVELYELLGASMLAQLNGDFSFVILNTETNQVFAARDRLGVKPLYVYRNDQNIAFSSEINGLIQLFDIRDVDEEGLRQYKKLRTFFNNKTLYKNIESFPAGHYFENGQIKAYWELAYIPNKQPPTDEELAHLIVSSVKDRCLADVAVGSYLSGGLDSTIVAALSDTVDTWTVGFPDDNEFEWSKLAAKKLKKQHHCILVEYEDYLSTAKEMIALKQEPLSVPNEVLIYLMTKKVKQKNTVVLSGEGADELFFGYDRIFAWANNCKKFNLKAPLKKFCSGIIPEEIINRKKSAFLFP